MKRLGKYILFLGTLFVRRERFRTYLSLFVDESIKIGNNSLFIVVIVSVFIGAVTAVQTAINLISPLIPNYIISLVVRDSTILELAPTVTAIVLAGKVGSNIAGELGTMRITEQIDALEIMGINSASYLVLPKVAAAVFTYPLLVMLAMGLAIGGGYVASVVGQITTPEEYIYGIQYEFIPFYVTYALVKAVVFAFLIASISAFQGYYTSGGALEVGQASTKAVTNSCIAVLLADYVLTNVMLGV